jgi:glycosyltransferase involved in cell wall biosynthesis
VGARIPSTECVIDEGLDGLLVRSMHVGDLARSLLELLVDGDRRRTLGERGYRKTMERFTWDQVTDRWEQALQDSVAGQSDSRAVGRSDRLSSTA